jgi:hypothetical protein
LTFIVWFLNQNPFTPATELSTITDFEQRANWQMFAAFCCDPADKHAIKRGRTVSKAIAGLQRARRQNFT